ncbi:histidine-specific methyltransferase [Hypoxylon trugodes]|uniref:histidine-specific methyltransferase n=1 Tax=Hypoxylon trugodes TaxID=326681 RepID=UPI00219151B4|nr:histidine-specific methyltransferase [Hypoxylon trugodes]KAI1387346.1 histidine-specific methyltransferase [Hypoxylon trugodes]
MSPTVLDLEDQPQIFDIRQNYDGLDLKGEIVRGLGSQLPTLPSLLLWDDQGQDLFDRFSQTPTYYPFHGEIEVLSRYGSDIGASVPAEGALLELGCGAVRKTKSILSGFRQQQKPVNYFALDVSHQGLTTSLVELRKLFKDSPFITITGLLGTYDDCVAWLTGLKTMRALGSMTILWLGNSIANLDSHDQASAFLARFGTACQHARLACRFLVSTDICQRDEKVLEAYNVGRPEYRDFLLNALDAANLELGYEAFSADDWTPASWLDERERNLHFYLTAKYDVLVPLTSVAEGTDAVTIHKGQRVRVVTSGKWSEEVMGQICGKAGFHIQQRWKDDSGDYCIFLLKNVTANISDRRVVQPTAGVGEKILELKKRKI